MRRVLLVDDDDSMGQMLVAVLKRHQFEAVYVSSPDDALDKLDHGDFDVVVTDLKMRGMDGIALCERIVASRPELPVILLTAFGTFDAAVGAIRAGAYDFVTKPVENEVLLLAVERAWRHRNLHDEVKRLRLAVEQGRSLDDIVGGSAVMKKVFDLVDRVAQSDASVLITGESGTGKEMVARAIHRRSARSQAPFVAINCAAVPENLLESELFGHVKGAFTDARSARRGLFAQAQGGTLFLDEVGEMPIALQPKLLRAIQDRTVRPVGADTETPVDVRIVAATNRDLETAIDERRFREDLYYRLNVIHIPLPPLRARGNDTLLLAQQFLTRFAAQSQKSVAGLSTEAAERLLSYVWPGNVRELQNAMERAVALTRFDTISVDDLPDKIRSYRRSHVLIAAEDPSELVPLEEVERRYILRVMEAVAGNKTLAAQVLGLDRKTLYRKLERYAGGPPGT